MIESRVSEPATAEGLTGGAAWRRQALRVVRTAAQAAATEGAPTESAPAARIRLDRSFAQHGLLGAPQTLVVRIVVEAGPESAGLADLDVTFDVPHGCADGTGEASAGWYGPSDGWSFTVACLGYRAAVALAHPVPLAAGALAEATFRLTLADGADTSAGLVLRASARDAASGAPWTDAVRLHVERVGL